MSARACAAMALFALELGVSHASADPYRLRADAYFTGSATSAGLFVLQGESRIPSWIDAEAAVWMGTGSYTGDVLSAVVRVREPQGRAELRLGRLFITTGGIRPVQLDGADATLRAPWGTSLEVFAGIPVTRAYASRDFDWSIGQRLGQKVGEDASVGVSYLHTRTGGTVSMEELGLDAAVRVTRWLDGAFMGAFDLYQPAIADARVSLAARVSSLRFELFGVHRAPSHLLPATSLFSALGDMPSQRAGLSIFWRAAPRLDCVGEGAAESLGDQPGAEFRLRSTLRLDDKGKGALALELRRIDVPGSSWSGARLMARLPFTRALAASTELEIAVPDDPRGRGVVWPWGLVALRYRVADPWEIAGAMEASASPTNLASLSGIVRISRSFGGGP